MALIAVMKWGSVKDYLCACKYTTRSYELKTLAMLREGGQDKLAGELEKALGNSKTAAHPGKQGQGKLDTGPPGEGITGWGRDD